MSMENLGPYTNFHELNQDWFLQEFNKIIAQWKAMQKNFDTLQDAFNDLKSYVQDYFKNLDVQDEINNKINEMFENGTFQEIFNKYINNYYGFISVLDYGADPTGKTDSSDAFNSAINICNKIKGSLGVPAGQYTISKNLVNINVNVSIIGLLDAQNDEFSNGSIIIDKRDSNTPLFNFTGGNGGNTIRNITFWCRETEKNDNAICIKGNNIGWDLRIYDCTFAFYDCALYLDGDDLQMSRVKIVFCGKDNYAFHLGTNSSMINALHIEHCRLMLETPNLYTFANHITQSKFEMSTFFLSRNNKPFISLNGYNEYGLCNFTDCNFYCLDYLSFVEKGVSYNEVPYMIDTGERPTILTSSMLNCIGFYNCNFNIGAGSGEYASKPISYNSKFINCTKPITMIGCSIHNLSGDLESLIFKNSRSKITNNKFYYNFTDFRNTTYSTFCKLKKKLFEIYNCDFKYNTIYYDDSIFTVESTECDVPNHYINLNYKTRGISYPIKTSQFTESDIQKDYILLASVQLYNGAGALASIKIKDKFNGNSVVYEMSVNGSIKNVNTSNWKLTPLFKSSDDMKMCITASNNLLKIYYLVNTSLTNKMSLDVDVDIFSAGDIIKYTSAMFENPDKTIPYLEK